METVMETLMVVMYQGRAMMNPLQIHQLILQPKVCDSVILCSGYLS